MHLLTRVSQVPSAVPLRVAVLCVECETVTGSRVDRCPVCGSSSVFSIAPMLGGTLAETKARQGRDNKFNLAIHIALEDIDGKDVNAALSDITQLVGITLQERRASVHFDVEPVVSESSEPEAKAA